MNLDFPDLTFFSLILETTNKKDTATPAINSVSNCGLSRFGPYVERNRVNLLTDFFGVFFGSHEPVAGVDYQKEAEQSKQFHFSKIFIIFCSNTV